MPTSSERIWLTEIRLNGRLLFGDENSERSLRHRTAAANAVAGFSGPDTPWGTALGHREQARNSTDVIRATTREGIPGAEQAFASRREYADRRHRLSELEAGGHQRGSSSFNLWAAGLSG